MKILDDKLLVFFCAMSFLIMAFFGIFSDQREKRLVSTATEKHFQELEARQKLEYIRFTSNVIQVISGFVSNGVFSANSSGRGGSQMGGTYRPDITVGWVNNRAFAWVNGRLCTEGDYIADGVIRRICPDGIVLDTGAVLSVVSRSEGNKKEVVDNVDRNTSFAN